MKSAVARIAINICRITSVVALMRSLDALLMAADDVSRTAGEKTDYDLVWALMSCPGLSPSPHIARENVQDGVVSRFDLTLYWHSRSLYTCTRAIYFRSFRQSKPFSRSYRRTHFLICCRSVSPAARPFRWANGAGYLPARSTRC